MDVKRDGFTVKPEHKLRLLGRKILEPKELLKIILKKLFPASRTYMIPRLSWISKVIFMLRSIWIHLYILHAKCLNITWQTKWNLCLSHSSNNKLKTEYNKDEIIEKFLSTGISAWTSQFLSYLCILRNKSWTSDFAERSSSLRESQEVLYVARENERRYWFRTREPGWSATRWRLQYYR